MGADTKIGWTHHSFNGWHGCTKIAAPNGERSACDFCYAAAFAKRTGHDIWGADAPRRFFGDKHWAEPLKWNRDAEAAGERRRVFCASMADVFEARIDLDESRQRLFELIEETPWLDWLLLTKRPEWMVQLAPKRWADGWPANVWAGTTVENQRCANIRIPRLLAVPARVRWLSCEPLFETVDLTPWALRLHWIVVGGESGPGRAELDLEAVRLMKVQCDNAGIAFFMKQDSGLYPGRRGRIPDELWMHEWPDMTIGKA